MITKLRRASKRVLSPIARAFIALGLSANSVTWIGFGLAMLYLCLAYLRFHPLVLALIMAVSSLMDAVDGEVARAKGTAGPKGAFLDSTLDRFEDSAFVFGLDFLGFNQIVVVALLAASLIIPYVRAKGELSGLKVEGRGIIERGERLIGILLVLIFTALWMPLAEALLYILTVLSYVTVVQRFLFVYFRLPK
ncbi:MAG: archaetidylinositol phosphate synthase [Sulfolobaceae archaeon]|nr:archaetidylinositol phosphate synthase [Sulfolobales archaeon]